MSRIGKKPIEIPQGVEVKLEDEMIIVKGPKGSLELKLRPEIEVKVEENVIKVLPKKETKKTKAFWGLFRSLIANMVKGVTEGYQKKLEVQGIGYRAEIDNATGDLVLEVGYSHPVRYKKPEGIEISVDKNVITIAGIDKQKVGQVAAEIRSIRPPDPYKGKGIRYLGEKIKLKLGKKAAGTK